MTGSQIALILNAKFATLNVTLAMEVLLIIVLLVPAIVFTNKAPKLVFRAAILISTEAILLI